MRALIAQDAFFYYGLSEAEQRAIAYETAKKQGLKGKELTAAVREAVNDKPEAINNAEIIAEREGLRGVNYKRRVYEILEQGRNKNIVEEADKFAARGTLNYEPRGVIGAVARSIQLFQRNPGGKYSKFIVPFTNIVANVMNNNIDWTPYGYKRAFFGYFGDEGGMKGREFKRQIARASIGTMALGLVIKAALDEWDGFDITAVGTGNNDKNNQLRETGWRPYSFKYKGRWIPYLYTPLVIPFTVAGYLKDMLRYKKDINEQMWYDTAGAVAMLTASSIMDQSFLSGMKDFLSIFDQNKEGAGEEYVKRLIASTASTYAVPNFVKQFNQLISEGKMYEAKTLKEMFLRNIGVAQDITGLRQRVNLLGEPVKKDGLFDWLKGVEVKDSPVWQMIVENSAFISKPSQNTIIRDPKMDYKERAMTPDEFYEYVRRSGQRIKMILEDNMSEIKKYNGDEIRSVARDITNDMRDITRQEIALGLPPETVKYNVKMNMEKMKVNNLLKEKNVVNPETMEVIRHNLSKNEQESGVFEKERVTDTLLKQVDRIKDQKARGIITEEQKNKELDKVREVMKELGIQYRFGN